MSEIAETVAIQQNSEVVQTGEKPTDTAEATLEGVVESTEINEQNGEKTESTQIEATEEKETGTEAEAEGDAEADTEAEAEAAEEEDKVENGEAKDTNGNDRKRVSSAHDEAAAVEDEEVAPSTKKSKVDEEVDIAASEDAPAVVAE